MIRLATQDDRPAVEAIVQAAYHPYIARIGRKPGPMLDDYGALIKQQAVRVLENDGIIQGILVLIAEAEAMLLDNIAVAPGSQGQGAGRVLLVHAEDTAIASGYQTIKLYTNAAMTENIALYQRIGYHETHRATEHGLHRVYMRKTLSQQ